MRSVLFFALSLLLVASNAEAGQVSYADGRGAWQPSKCTLPPQPTVAAHNAEAEANSLNEQITAHNTYAAAAQDYMNCISQEAQADAQASAQIVTQSAQQIMQKVQADVTASSNRLNAARAAH